MFELMDILIMQSEKTLLPKASKSLVSKVLFKKQFEAAVEYNKCTNDNNVLANALNQKTLEIYKAAGIEPPEDFIDFMEQ